MRKKKTIVLGPVQNSNIQYNLNHLYDPLPIATNGETSYVRNHKRKWAKVLGPFSHQLVDPETHEELENDLIGLVEIEQKKLDEEKKLATKTES